MRNCTTRICHRPIVPWISFEVIFVRSQQALNSTQDSRLYHRPPFVILFGFTNIFLKQSTTKERERERERGERGGDMGS